MLRIYKSENGGKLVKLKKNKVASLSWYNMINPSIEEMEKVSDQLKLDFEEQSEQRKLFTDIGNKYWTEPAEVGDQGTRLEIYSLNDVWVEKDTTNVFHMKVMNIY